MSPIGGTRRQPATRFHLQAKRALWAFWEPAQPVPDTHTLQKCWLCSACVAARDGARLRGAAWGDGAGGSPTLLSEHAGIQQALCSLLRALPYCKSTGKKGPELPLSRPSPECLVPFPIISPVAFLPMRYPGPAAPAVR